MQRRIRIAAFAIATATPLTLSGELYAQQQPPQFPNMTFFITSSNPGKGADLGGLEGADKHCQTLAARHGAGGKTWRAYLRVGFESHEARAMRRTRSMTEAA